MIGFGAPNKAGTSGAHGSPLGDKEIAGTRKALGWDEEPFVVPSDILDAWRLAGLRSVKDRKAWEARLAEAENDVRMTFGRRISGELPGAIEPALIAYKRKLT